MSQSLPNQGTWSTKASVQKYEIELKKSQSLPNQGTWSTLSTTERSLLRADRLNPFQIREPGRPGIRFRGGPHPVVSIPSKSGNLVDPRRSARRSGFDSLSQSLPNQGTWSTRSAASGLRSLPSLNPFQIREPGRPSRYQRARDVAGLNPFQIREPGRPVNSLTHCIFTLSQSLPNQGTWSTNSNYG